MLLNRHKHIDTYKNIHKKSKSKFNELIKSFEGTRKLMAEGKIINAGALIEDEVMVGSTLLVDFDTDEEIDEWLENEPYVKNNVWNMDEFQIVPIKLLPKN